MRKSTTKRALFSSIVSMLLCISMLLGSTFAWFTDSVSVPENQIVAGNLDIELYHSNRVDTNERVGATTALFDDVTLWEPGAVAYENLKLTNEGTLALKYNLAINFTDYNTVTENGKSLKDILKIALVEGAVATTGVEETDRANAIALGEGKFEAINDFNFEGALMAENNTDDTDEKSLALVIWWEPSANDNDFNVNNNKTTSDNKALHVNLGLQLLATQQVKELDSFGPEYDKDAVYADTYVTDAAGLADAIAEGGTIALMNDIEIATINVPKGVAATINLNGNDISGTSTKNSGNQSSFVVNGDLTIEGTGTVSHNHTGANMGWGNLTAAFSVEGGTLTLGEGVSVVNNGGSDMAYAVDVNTTLGTTTLNVNGATLYSAYTGVRIFNNNKTAKGIVNFNDGFIEGDNRDIWHQVASATFPAENGVVNIADGYNYTTEATSYYGAKYFFTDYLVATDDDGLDDAIEGGATTLVLSSGNYVIPDSAQGKTLTIVGSGDTVIATQDDGSYEGCDYSLDGAKVTFENITITTDSRTYTGYARCSATYNNCTINGAYTLYGESVFNNCTFNVTGDVYNIWTWGGKKVEFNGCTFNTSGKSILVYNQSCDVYVNNCIFNDSTNGTGFTKSALETGVDGVGPKYNIYINDTTVNGFAENNVCVGYKNIVGNKNSLSNEYLNIVVDGTDVY